MATWHSSGIHADTQGEIKSKHCETNRNEVVHSRGNKQFDRDPTSMSNNWLVLCRWLGLVDLCRLRTGDTCSSDKVPKPFGVRSLRSIDASPKRKARRSCKGLQTRSCQGGRPPPLRVIVSVPSQGCIRILLVFATSLRREHFQPASAKWYSRTHCKARPCWGGDVSCCGHGQLSNDGQTKLGRHEVAVNSEAKPPASHVESRGCWLGVYDHDLQDMGVSRLWTDDH